MRRAIASLLAAVAAAAVFDAPSQVLGGTAARYAGMLPCGDCPAIRMELTLVTELGRPTRYEQRMTYVDTRQGDRSFGVEGRWNLVKGRAGDPEASVVELVGMSLGERHYLLKLGDDALRVLDAQRGEIDSPWPQVLWRAERERVGDPVVVWEQQSGATLHLHPGQELVLRLGANRATGYRWAPRLSAYNAVALLATPGYESAGGQPGAGGTEVWRFSAVAPGVQTLTLDYARPWEGNIAPARTVSFTVAVQ